MYDPDKWAVVFRFSSVNIPSNVTVTFTNHPSRAPVVWLVSGTVTIAGTVSLNGANGHAAGAPSLSEPGPGGFRGGRGNNGIASPQSGGFGPGGPRNTNSNGFPAGGSYGVAGLPGSSPNSLGPGYGNASVLPLIGGSGGTGFIRPPGTVFGDAGGGAGGGAILIVATQAITLTGAIRANGGIGGSNASGGSGGAIRLVADLATGSGILSAIGGAGGGNNNNSGGDGRIRVETNQSSTLTGGPNPSFSTVGATALIWPPAGAPTIKATVLDGLSVPANPLASLDFPAADVNVTNPNPMTLQLDCTNIPTNSTVTVRVVPKSGTNCLPGMSADCTYPASFVSGDVNASIWTATIRTPDGFSAIQARAVLP